MLAAALMLTGCGEKEGTGQEGTGQESVGQALSETQTEASAAVTSAGAGAAENSSEEAVDGVLIKDHEEALQYAQLFSMTHYKGGYISFTIKGGEEAGTWLIVPEGKSVPEDLEENTIVIQQPVEHIRCDSGTAAVINAFGGLSRVSTVNSDIDSFEIPEIQNKMKAGEILYSGSYGEPDYEMITAADTQLVVDTSMLDTVPEVKDKYAELGIPCYVTYNSKEVHPLGHSEWAKVHGAVLGMWDEANAYFEEQVAKVESVAADEETDKTVAVVYFSSDGAKVYARRGGDYLAKMVELAGGDYIMADFEPEKTGVGTLTMEDFYALCKDADYLINLNMSAKLYTMEELLDYVPIMEDFKSVKDGNVYVARNRFSQFTFDNASIIQDMNTILKDSSVEDTAYFDKMK